MSMYITNNQCSNFFKEKIKILIDFTESSNTGNIERVTMIEVVWASGFDRTALTG
jgi:hypothetical protein